MSEYRRIPIPKSLMEATQAATMWSASILSLMGGTGQAIPEMQSPTQSYICAAPAQEVPQEPPPPAQGPFVMDMMPDPGAIVIENLYYPPEKPAVIYQPHHIAIEKVGINNPIMPGAVSNGEWQTPNYGVAAMSGLGSRRMVVYSHSSWDGVKQPFHLLEELQKGDEFVITATREQADQPEIITQPTEYRFKTIGFMLLDKDNKEQAEAFLQQPSAFPIAFLVTTLHENDGGLLLDRNKICAKESVFEDPSVVNLNVYGIYVVIGVAEESP